MAYTPITKLEKFSGKEDDAQTWINDVTKAIITNNWNDARALQAISYFLQNAKPQTFDAFKLEFLRYFSNSNSINCLANIFTTIKQEDTEAVTTYLEYFHQNLCQIQAIDANYFTTAQILNQFICVLCSITCTRNFELAELEANHT
ncbi:hypothetical protein G9A89_021565 [Geosiphon pyriformis]|nr:hypothetical protein G9A89_021565 [Geosiphon pyriformis]